ADESEPGFSHIVFKPEVLQLGHASSSLQTVKGLVSCSWSSSEGKFEISVHVPVGSHGTVYLPKGRLLIDSKEVRDRLPEGITEIREEGGKLVVSMLSGDYEFSVDLRL
ncbi:MAG: alpha-L-rhamnosidase C-terminal domain-containing protein, partial [TACK group archaeon]|nr:alpha-L-rhamnosidase C-terminal domain-containing protein [TACK group archaeon]